MQNVNPDQIPVTDTEGVADESLVSDARNGVTPSEESEQRCRTTLGAGGSEHFDRPYGRGGCVGDASGR